MTLLRKTPLRDSKTPLGARSTLKRGTGIKKSSTKRTKASKKKKLTRKELWGQYGLQVPAYIRYPGLQGILWWVLSQYVRRTEFEQYGGACVDGCGRIVIDWRDADCGHFRSAKSLSTRFIRENLGLQAKYCNSPRGGNGNQYAFGKAIDQRYGEGTADHLTETAKHTSPPYSKQYIDLQIRHYLALGDKPFSPAKPCQDDITS